MRRHQPWLIVVFVGAVAGAAFAALSTYDFVQHLDRQVHNLHCSFIPGASHAGESGCQVAMMSPYSSVLRTQVWGGIPIALAAMSVFAFLAFYTLDLMLTRRKDDPRATGFLALATALPAVTSAVMLAISIARLGTTCKVCVCIYIASAVCLVGGLFVWRGAARGHVASPSWDRDDDHHRHREPAFIGSARADSGARLVAVGVDTAPVSSGFLAGMFAVGVAFVAIPVVLYLAMAPDHARFIGTCEGLAHPEDSYGVMVQVERVRARGAPAIEVLDPLCPACRAFEQRLAASGLGDRIERKAVLFPLDNTCNWMVSEATHPGACTVSEAVLCAGDKAPEVIAWAFETQDRIRSEAKTDPTAAARIVKQRFPELASCVGSPEARSRLNKSMRWIVANNIRVLTPQLFVNNVKLCDEDVDLGLEYTLSNMLARYAHGALTALPLEKGAPPPASVRASDSAQDRAPDSASDRSSPDKASDGTPPDKASLDKAAPDKASADKASADKASADKASADKASADKAARERSSSGKAASDRESSDRPSPDKPGSDKAASDRAASEAPDKASPDKASPDKPSPDKASPDKASPDKPSPDKPAPDKSAPDKPAPDKSAPDKPAPDKPVPDKSGPVTHPGDTP
jgi:uncharacterized membrane protein